jgi:hypothetical protein
MKKLASVAVVLSTAVCTAAPAETWRAETKRGWGSPDVAEASEALTWKATIQQTGGNTTLCLSGHRGRIETLGPELAVYAAPNKAPIIKVRLAADGSAGVDTRLWYYGPDKAARVKVPPGSGPRLVQFVTLSQVCAYNVVPD